MALAVQVNRPYLNAVFVIAYFNWNVALPTT
jgi:hypothetical protein